MFSPKNNPLPPKSILLILYLLTTDIGHLVFTIRFLAFGPHFAHVLAIRRPIKELLLRLTVQDLHEAVGVRVVVDGGPLGGVPTQDHQVEFTISCIDQVPRVS